MLIEMAKFTVIIIVLILLFYWIYFKIKNPFWSMQPVTHSHNLIQRYTKPTVILDNFYISKFVNPINITTIKWSDCKYKKDIETHISNFFYKEKNGHYRPNCEIHISPYYDNDANSYISVYRLDSLLIGCIINRTLRVHFRGDKFAVSYIDYLCVHKGHRKKRVAPELIQTHEYFQRTKSTKKCKISLFKKEGRLHNFIPLVKYKTYFYALRNNTYISNVNPSMSYEYEIIQVSLIMINQMLEFLNNIRLKKECFIVPSLETLTQLIEKKSIFIYCILHKQTKEINALYFFRKTGLQLNSSKENIECFSSTYNNINESIFINGFLISLKKEKEKYGYLQLEAIGDNTIINSNIINYGINPKYSVPCAYYLYNYNNPSLLAKNVEIIN